MVEGFYPITDAVTREAIGETGFDASLLTPSQIAAVTKELNEVRPAGQTDWSHTVRLKVGEETHYLTLHWQNTHDRMDGQLRNGGGYWNKVGDRIDNDLELKEPKVSDADREFVRQFWQAEWDAYRKSGAVGLPIMKEGE